MKIVGSAAALEKIIIDAALRKINIGLRSSVADIYSTTQTLIEKAIRNSKEYSSLLNGQLKGHFGLSSPGIILDQIVDTLKRDIQIITKPFKYSGNSIITGGMDINIIKKDMTDILLLPGAQYYSYSKRAGRTLIPWLRWLLFSDDIIPLVNNYDITFNLNTPGKVKASRSKKALMFLSPGAQYTFPREFGGGRDGNWIVRAMQDAVQFPLQLYIEEVFLQRIPA